MAKVGVSSKSNFWRQHNIGKIWGRFALSASQVGMLITLYTLLVVIISVYIPTSAWLAKYDIYVPLWVFVGIAFMPIVVALVIAWKFLVVSYFDSSTEQFWAQSKVWTARLKKLDAIEINQKKIMRKLGIEDDDKE